MIFKSDEIKLLEMIAEGLPYKDIAQRSGKTINAITNRLYHIKLRHQSPSLPHLVAKAFREKAIK